MLGRLLALATFAGVLLAQHAHRASSEKPVTLLTGLGTYQHRISTANPEAQKFFNQGLILLYGFNRYEALRSFVRAAELDPEAPMPQVGIALAYGPHINMDMDGDTDTAKSCAAIAAAQKLRANGSEREGAYIEALSSRCPEYKPDAYIAAVRELHRRYPDDHDAAALFAESVMVLHRWKWFQGGVPAPGMQEAITTLEQTMRRNPDHPGANHFYIHAVEMSPEPERAIPSAQRLMGQVPAAGHLLHMPGHIWMVLGEYELVVSINERAAQVDRQYFEKTGVQQGAYGGYYAHNLHFITAAQMMRGRRADSLKAASDVFQATQPFMESMAAMLDPFVAMPLFVQMRFGMWDEILGLPAPDPRLISLTALWHWARASAYAAKGQRSEALAEKGLFEKATFKVPTDAQWIVNRSRQILSLASVILAARLAETPAASIPRWKQAVEIQDGLVYDEPPAWYYPVRESLGGALLRAGQPAEAEAVFREALRRTPKNGRVLFGLLESLKAQNKTDAAVLVQIEFDVAWRQSDIPLAVADL
jgi:tetratricopeptide (TPR) repeat protein